MKIILRLLLDFKFARKRLGGKWYYVATGEEVHGFGGTIYYWKNHPPISNETVLKEESYP